MDRINRLRNIYKKIMEDFEILMGPYLRLLHEEQVPLSLYFPDRVGELSDDGSHPVLSFLSARAPSRSRVIICFFRLENLNLKGK